MKRFNLFLFSLMFTISLGGYAQDYILQSGDVEYKKDISGNWLEARCNPQTPIHLKANWIIKSNRKFTVRENKEGRFDITCGSSKGEKLSDLISKGYKQEIKQKSKSVVVRGPEPISEVPKGFDDENQAHNFHYLIVDVRDFEDSNWKSLANSKAGIDSLQKALDNMLEQPDNKYYRKNCKVLDTKEKTKADTIRYHINALVDGVKDNNDDVVLLYFSSHGQYDGEKFRLITSDTRNDTINKVLSNSITADEINKYVSLLTKKRAKVFVFVDACRAGALTEGLIGNSVQESAYFLSTANDLNAFLPKTGSRFAEALTRSLSGKEQDFFKNDSSNIVTPLKLERYIDYTVRSEVQTPKSNRYPYNRNEYSFQNKKLWTIKPQGIIADLQNKAGSGDTKAMINLGDIYYWGSDKENVSQDYSKAYSFYKMAHDNGNALGSCKLGICYYYGKGVSERNYQKAFNLFQESACKDIDLAKYYLSVCYTKGTGVKKSTNKAKAIFKKINSLYDNDICNAYRLEEVTYKVSFVDDTFYQFSDDNDTMPRRVTRIMTINVVGVGDKSYRYVKPTKHWMIKVGNAVGVAKEGTDRITFEPKIIELKKSEERIKNMQLIESVEKSIEDDDTKMQLKLGLNYFHGGRQEVIKKRFADFETDYKKALYWFEKAAKQGDGEALNMVGLCYQYGKGISPDYLKASEYYKQAGEKGIWSAYLNLGNIYYEGDDHLKKNERDASAYYEIAAEKGEKVAQYNYGVCLRNGTGIDNDDEKAFMWLQASAKQNYAPAQYLLGVCYFNGEGVSQDYDMAFDWIDKAAKQGNEEAIKMKDKYWYVKGKLKPIDE